MAAAEVRGRRVLIYAPIGRDAKTASELLSRAGMLPCICDSYDDLLAQLHSGSVDAAFVAEEGLFGQELGRLDDWISAQPAWSDLPFVMLTSRHDQPRVAAWRHKQISRMGNISLVERPVQPITLVSILQTALRARQRQLEIQSLLEAREVAAAQLETTVTRRTAQLEQVNSQLRDEMKERARVEESLRHAQKLEALGQLTGGVAHDFNNLLTVILAGLDMLEANADSPRRGKWLHSMRHAAQRGSALTRQLLAFSRSHALNPETVYLSKLVGDMRELLDRSLRGDIEVKVELASDLWPVHADPGELELVILNLAVNARDAIQGGGTITIAAHNLVADRAGNPEMEAFVCLSVRDTGAGMSDEVKARVFEPFFTTKDVGKGSGLGLAQVYGFATQSGGSVEIESEEGHGTTITLKLPRGEHSDVEHARSNHTLSAPPPADAAILLVEDDVEVAALVEEMLQSLGYEVLHAASAKAALGALANGRHMDLVFSDIMMPGGTNGLDLAKEVKIRQPDLPVLLTSGYSDASKHDVAKIGVPILKKPYGIDELRAAIHQQLRGGKRE